MQVTCLSGIVCKFSLVSRSLHSSPHPRDVHIAPPGPSPFFCCLNESSCCHERLREHNIAGVMCQLRWTVILQKKKNSNGKCGSRCIRHNGGSHCLPCVLTDPILAPFVGASSFYPQDQVMSEAVYYLLFMKASWGSPVAQGHAADRDRARLCHRRIALHTRWLFTSPRRGYFLQP